MWSRGLGWSIGMERSRGSIRMEYSWERSKGLGRSIGVKRSRGLRRSIGVGEE